MGILKQAIARQDKADKIADCERAVIDAAVVWDAWEQKTHPEMAQRLVEAVRELLKARKA